VKRRGGGGDSVGQSQTLTGQAGGKGGVRVGRGKRQYRRELWNDWRHVPPHSNVIAIGGCRRGGSRRAFFSGILLTRSAGPAPASTSFHGKLGWKTFDVNSEEIDASYSGVTAADCSALAARMKTGEISRVKKLNLVRFISVLFLLCFIF
jgi:hypothetical protein